MRPYCKLGYNTAHHALKQRARVLVELAKAAESHNVDGIHDFRVASRRVRAVLDDYTAQYGKKALKPFNKRVKKITRGLGVARELDVTIGLLRQLRGKTPKPAHHALTVTLRWLGTLRNDASASVDRSCALVRDEDFFAEYDKLLHAVKRGTPCFRKMTAKALRDRHVALMGAYKKWKSAPTDKALHRVRVSFKKFRYSCEIASDLYGEPMVAYIETLRTAQAVLGDWNDTRVARDYIRLAAKRHADLADQFALLDNVVRNDADALRDAFKTAAPSYFGRHARASAKALFASPKTKCCDRSGKT